MKQIAFWWAKKLGSSENEILSIKEDNIIVYGWLFSLVATITTLIILAIKVF